MYMYIYVCVYIYKPILFWKWVDKCLNIPRVWLQLRVTSPLCVTGTNTVSAATCCARYEKSLSKYCTVLKNNVFNCSAILLYRQTEVPKMFATGSEGSKKK